MARHSTVSRETAVAFDNPGLGIGVSDFLTIGLPSPGASTRPKKCIQTRKALKLSLLREAHDRCNCPIFRTAVFSASYRALRDVQVT